MTFRSKFFINKAYVETKHSRETPHYLNVVEVEVDPDGNYVGDRDVTTSIGYKPKALFDGIRASSWYRTAFVAGMDGAPEDCMLSLDTLNAAYVEITKCKARKVLDIKFWPDKEGLYDLDGLLR